MVRHENSGKDTFCATIRLSCSSIALFPEISGGGISSYVFTKLDARDGLSDNQVLHILQLADGRMAITTSGNVNIYDGAKFSYVHYSDSSMYRLEGYDGAYHVYAGRDNRLWIKDCRYLQCLDVERLSYIEDIADIFREMKPGVKRVDDIFLDQSSDVWLVDADGLWDVENQKIFPLDASLGQLQDLDVKNDTLFLFFGKGIVAGFDRTSARLLFEKPAYGGDDVYKFARTSLVKLSPDGAFYQIRTDYRQSILLRFDPESLQWTEIFRTPVLLHTLAVSEDGNLYVTGRNGMWFVDHSTLKPTLMERIETTRGSVKADNFNTVFIDSHNGIWLGTYKSGLLYTHPLRCRMQWSEQKPDNFDFYRRKMPESLPPKVYDMLTDSRGMDWMATSDGLKVTDRQGRRYAIYTDHGLVNNNVKALLEDKAGTIWVSTSSGISSVRVGYSGESPSFDVKSFNADDGVLNGEYLPREAYMSSEGYLAFRNEDGWTFFHPDSLKHYMEVFNPIFTRFAANGRTLAMSDGIILPYTDNNLSVDVASLNYALPLSSYFKVRVMKDGHEVVPWTVYSANDGVVDKSGFMHLKFMNQLPGKYIVDVASASSPDKLDEAPVSTLGFRILPPWWLEWWAMTLYVFIIVAVAGLVVVSYNRRVKYKLKQQHREEMLLMRIRNLIDRCNAYEQYVKTNSLESTKTEAENNPAEEAEEVEDEPEQKMSQRDREFIAKAVQLVENNIGMRGFTVEMLSKELCMERTGLYKKMKSLLDKSPNAFIRSIRLNRAAELIAEGELAVTEIAERTGFSSVSHLSKCFLEEYGCRPSEYASKSTSV